jgi:hypothetical protein
MPEKHKEHIKQICDIMGEDLDAPACQEVLRHLDDCPNCKVYYDTIKKTVHLCKENDCAEELPNDVNQRLMKVLDLGEFLPDQKQKD